MLFAVAGILKTEQSVQAGKEFLQVVVRVK
jgi:hypothetical protein